jgi:hypothetical protein
MKRYLPYLSFCGKSLFILILLSSAHDQSFGQVVDYGKTYVNLNKGNSGGTIEPGDTLQIRATFVVKSGTVDSCAFYDTIPAGTAYVPGTLAVLTNEGKIFRKFTDAYGGVTPDPGWIVGNNLQINLGYGATKFATQFARGEIKNTYKPSFYGSACIMVASYEVVVTAPYFSKISVGGGAVSYSAAPPAVSFQRFPLDSIMVFPNYGICPNAAGANAILSEFGGTFGSGNVKDRAPSSNVPSNYTYTAFSAALGMPNDYYYGVSNNTSGGTTAATGYSVINTYSYPDNSAPSTHRIFSVWDIIGDHTGAANPLLGNPPTDDLNGKSGGYMAVINSSYKTDIAFLDTVSNLCPNTYYKYTAWFYNMCPKCGCDSNGTGASSSSGLPYQPTGPGDSSGVHPNLTFNVNGYDYYTTGNILHTGRWIQKGFTYLTGPTQTSMIIYIRNNAPGGGGNDWAVDDIGVATCVPNISLTPNKPDTLCRGADDTVRFKVSAFFPNYTEWLLQKSTDGGVTWTSPGIDTLGQTASGSASPVYNPSSGQYEYLVTRYYRISSTDNIITYRLTIASTGGSLTNSNCNYIASTPKVVYAVNCNIVLPTTIVLKGWLNGQHANLQWTSTNESGNVRYVVERSDGDETHFTAIDAVNGVGPQGTGAHYSFNDPNQVSAQTYYRINIDQNEGHAYSQVVLLGISAFDFEIRSLVNPFVNTLSFDLIAPGDQTVSIVVNDIYGRTIRRETQSAAKGVNTIRLYGFDALPTGTYILQVRSGENSISRKIVKMKY